MTSDKKCIPRESWTCKNFRVYVFQDWGVQTCSARLRTCVCPQKILIHLKPRTYWIVCSESTYFDQLANAAVIDIFTIVKYGIFILFLETEMNGSRCMNDLMTIFYPSVYGDHSRTAFFFAKLDLITQKKNILKKTLIATFRLFRLYLK